MQNHFVFKIKKMKTNEELLSNQDNQFTQSQISDEVNDERDLEESISKTIGIVINDIITNSKSSTKINSQEVAIKVTEKLSQKLQSIISENSIDLSNEVDKYLENRVFYFSGNIYGYQNEVTGKSTIVSITFSRNIW